ncbi:hypothetical protein K9L63_00090 [Candidatus Gracilibacteria bacterium]|nr:hypothetical protein [Candidatus Gracilibacteria bacterium]
MENLKHEIETIKERNNRVELDKKWETSWTRRIFLAVLSYVATYIFLRIIHAENAVYGAMIPAGAYLLQQMTVRPLRAFWENANK